MKEYSMQESTEVANEAWNDINAFLTKFDTTIEVRNVEKEIIYQKLDIDAIWVRTHPKVPEKIIADFIEIKGDRHHSTNNYFFETISNKTKGTLGCFMYSKAKYLYYYFVEEKELHVIPLEKTRNWFKDNIHKFKEVETSTIVNGNNYITVGRLVNREFCKANVPEIKILPLK